MIELILPALIAVGAGVLFLFGIISFSLLILIAGILFVIEIIAGVYYFFALKKEKPKRTDYKLNMEK